MIQTPTPNVYVATHSKDNIEFTEVISTQGICKEVRVKSIKTKYTFGCFIHEILKN